jgi:UDP-N-acetylmuramate dehydrogenase
MDDLEKSSCGSKITSSTYSAGEACATLIGVRRPLDPPRRPKPKMDSSPPSALDPERIRALEQRLAPLPVLRSVPLAPWTTFRIGGPADLFVQTPGVDALVEAIHAARALEIPYFLLGKGANILVGDRGFRGLVIHAANRGIEFLEGDRVRAEAGVDVFPDLIVDTVARGLGGLHHFVGIPSSVGGALWQNLHFLSPAPERARTVFIAECLESADLLTVEGERRNVDVNYFEFGYDDSTLQHRADIVLRATFQLTRVPEADLRRVMRENLAWRDDRHPDLWLYPSAGSIFRKAGEEGAGRLIDACGLKGHVLGNAALFHKHANIIVNLGGATAHDVRGLISLARETVARETGIALIPEIGFVGEF